MKRKRPTPPTTTLSDSKRLKPSKSKPSQNAHLPKLPPNIAVAKRPINKPPSASPYAGADVPKVVYVSRKTPVISAVKRVKKFLEEIEKRALQGSGVDRIGLDGGRRGRGGDEGEELRRKLVEVGERLENAGEEVVVKGCGKAREQALRVGEWFRGREEEMLLKVVVREGKVSVVDDLIEKGSVSDDGGVGEVNEEDGAWEDKENEGIEEGTILEGGDTTLELLGRHQAVQRDHDSASEHILHKDPDESVLRPKRKRPRKKRREYDPDDVPEARLRWVSTVEIAISLRA